MALPSTSLLKASIRSNGNNDERVDSIACDLVKRFMQKISVLPTYRNAVPTQSILTITSNVVYGRRLAIRRMDAAPERRSRRGEPDARS
ncbi:formate acetyltransferase [Salmonella enterica subsp. enterica]|uniref:Formate acetyltransferase n=1 Tax=Salmonella enterica I TaxID=59201 RepID=A0A379VKW2_SALET|nr:formate acetyltransferase [Salmonella enterica subsp. enterica]